MTNELSIELVEVEILDGAIRGGDTPVLPLKATFRVKPLGLMLTAQYSMDLADDVSLLEETDAKGLASVAAELCRLGLSDLDLLNGSIFHQCVGNLNRRTLLNDARSWASEQSRSSS